jgi:hypothetical protein
MWFTSLTAATALLAGAAGVPAGRPSAPELRTTLEGILETGYQLTPPPEAQVWEAAARLLRLLRDALAGLSEAGPLAGVPGWAQPLVTGALVVLLGLLVAHIYASLRGLLTERRPRDGRREMGAPRMDPADLRRKAEAAREREDYDTALRLLYISVLLRLDRLGVLSHDPARTNWENLAAFRAVGSGEESVLADFTREIDALIYGGKSAHETTWQRAQGWAETLWRPEGER